MVSLSRELSRILVLEFGSKEFLSRLNDPFWFQAFSCVIGFDWHSSGVTTVTCGALKEALKENDIGLGVAGGKGFRRFGTRIEILRKGNSLNLTQKKSEEIIHASALSSTVDSSALQDSFELYHHCVFFGESGNWSIVQQGLNPEIKYARRYHWSDSCKDFVNEPHEAICCDFKSANVLNLVSSKSRENRKACLDLIKDPTHKIMNDFKLLRLNQKTLLNWNSPSVKRKENLLMPWNVNWNALEKAYNFQPKNYEELLLVKDVGPKTVRALSLISEFIYGEKADWKDPVKYSFTVGGKDNVPYPVERNTMDEATAILKNAVEEARIGRKEKMCSLKRLQDFVPKTLNN